MIGPEYVQSRVIDRTLSLMIGIHLKNEQSHSCFDVIRTFFRQRTSTCPSPGCNTTKTSARVDVDTYRLRATMRDKNSLSR